MYFMNEDLQTICQWTFTRKLLLNVDKTRLVVFGSRPSARKVEGLHLSLLGKERTNPSQISKGPWCNTQPQPNI